MRSSLSGSSEECEFLPSWAICMTMRPPEVNSVRHSPAISAICSWLQMPGGLRITVRAGAHRASYRDDQSGRCALPVIFGVEGHGNLAGVIGAIPTRFLSSMLPSRNGVNSEGSLDGDFAHIDGHQHRLQHRLIIPFVCVNPSFRRNHQSADIHVMGSVV